MGKAKKRGMAQKKPNKISNLSRENAVIQIVKNIENRQEAIDMVTLFGISAEELLEAGATYEDVISLGRIFK